MPSNSSIDDKSATADQRREFSRRAAPRQIHLKEAVLCVEEAGGAGDVRPSPPANRRNAERVAPDGDRCRQSRELMAAVEKGQTRLELMSRPEHGAHPQHRQEYDGEEEDSPAAHRVKITSE